MNHYSVFSHTTQWVLNLLVIFSLLFSAGNPAPNPVRSLPTGSSTAAGAGLASFFSWKDAQALIQNWVARWKPQQVNDPCPAGGETVNFSLSSGQTCELTAGDYVYNTITVQDGGTLILKGDTVANRGVFITAQTITVDSGGKIDADGQGFTGTDQGAGNGPGGGPLGLECGAGGSYGGYGSGTFFDRSIVGLTYGSHTEPSQLGSAGGAGYRYSTFIRGGDGGGAIHIKTTGQLILNGVISANGKPGWTYIRDYYYSEGGGSGSGGSIWLESSQIQGSGTVRANGGNIDTPNWTFGGGGSGGSGGRIAITGNTSQLTGPVEAYGSNARGSSGTIYYTDSNRLVIDNNNIDIDLISAATISPGIYNFSEIKITRKGALKILGQNSELTIPSTLTVDDSSRLIVEGLFRTPAEYEIQNFSLDVQGGFTGANNITINNKGHIILHANPPGSNPEYQNFESITVNSGGRLTLLPWDNMNENYQDDAPPHLQVNTVNIEAGGIIESDSAGYKGRPGKGYGIGAGEGDTGDGGYFRGAGGSYGGKGGGGINLTGKNLYQSGPVYGQETLNGPKLLGSAGGAGTAFYANHPWNRKGSPGGGAIWLTVNTELKNAGLVSADGGIGTGADSRGGGAGSGGSLLIETPKLSGSGTIRAKGGDSDYSGAGGGGRIAVLANDISSTMVFNANGGISTVGYDLAGNGTIYLGNIDPAKSTLTITALQGALAADDTERAELTVTLNNALNQPVVGFPVTLRLLDGADVWAGGQLLSKSPDSNGNSQHEKPIGSTDANGQLKVKLKAIKAGQRTFSARVHYVELTQQASVTFVAGPVDAAKSIIVAEMAEAPADGATPVNVTVTALDANQNPVSGKTVTLAATNGAVVTNPAQPTNAEGKATGTITGSTLSVSSISATITETSGPVQVTLPASVRFRGSDLDVKLTASAPLNGGGTSADQATAGNSITYTATLTNKSLTANGPTLTATLPVGLTLAAPLTCANFSQNGLSFTCGFDPLPAGQSTTLQWTAAIAPAVRGNVMTNVVVAAAAASLEENPDNNHAAKETTVLAPAPVLRLEPVNGLLEVLPDTPVSYSFDLFNDGLGSTGTINVSLPTHLRDWVTVTPASLPVVEPGKSTRLTLTLNASGKAFGTYLGTLAVNDGLNSTGLVEKALGIRVVRTQRPLEVTVRNDQGALVPGARLRLENTNESVWVKPDGTPEMYHPVYGAIADVNGKVTLSAMEASGYSYSLEAPYHQTATGTLEIKAEVGIQAESLTLVAEPGLFVTPTQASFVVAAKEQARQTLTVKNTGAAALSGIKLELSDLPAWVYPVVPEALNNLAPGAQVQVDLFAAPPAGTPAMSQTNGKVKVSAGDRSAMVDLAVRVLGAAETTRAVYFRAADESNKPVITNNGQVVLKRLKPAPLSIAGEGDVTYQPVFSAPIGTDGNAIFTGDSKLEIGQEYSYQVWADNYQVSEGTFTVTALQGSDPALEPVFVVMKPEPFIYTWNVTKIEGGIDLSYHMEVVITYTNGTPVSAKPTWCETGCAWDAATGKASWDTGTPEPDPSSGGGQGGPTLPSSIPAPRSRFSQMHSSRTGCIGLGSLPGGPVAEKYFVCHVRRTQNTGEDR
ncbi:MAG: Ig-like domain-containing protein [Bacteroidales bacterium]